MGGSRQRPLARTERHGTSGSRNTAWPTQLSTPGGTQVTKDLSPGPFSRNLSALGGSYRTTVSPFLISTVTSPKLTTAEGSGQNSRAAACHSLARVRAMQSARRAWATIKFSPASCFHKLARVKDTHGLGEEAGLRAGPDEEDITPAGKHGGGGACRAKQCQ